MALDTPNTGAYMYVCMYTGYIHMIYFIYDINIYDVYACVCVCVCVCVLHMDPFYGHQFDGYNMQRNNLKKPTS